MIGILWISLDREYIQHSLPLISSPLSFIPPRPRICVTRSVQYKYPCFRVTARILVHHSTPLAERALQVAVDLMSDFLLYLYKYSPSSLVPI